MRTRKFGSILYPLQPHVWTNFTDVCQRALTDPFERRREDSRTTDSRLTTTGFPASPALAIEVAEEIRRQRSQLSTVDSPYTSTNRQELA